MEVRFDYPKYMRPVFINESFNINNFISVLTEVVNKSFSTVPECKFVSEFLPITNQRVGQAIGARHRLGPAQGAVRGVGGRENKENLSVVENWFDFFQNIFINRVPI